MLADSLLFRNPLLRQAPNRWRPSKTESMINSAYLILLTSVSQLTTDDTRLILSSAGFGQALYGSSTDFVSQTLWLIRRPLNDANSIHQALSSISSIQSISIAPLDIPIESSQVTLIRNIFRELNWVSTSLTDPEISSYFESELKFTKTHYIHFDHHINTNKRITFKPLKDLPEYSTDWEESQKKLSEAIANGLYDNIDYSKITFTSVEISEIVEVNSERVNIPPPNKNQQ